MREKDIENRPHEPESAPDGYLRKSDLEAFVKALGAFMAILGFIFGGLKYVDSVRDYVDRRIDNERAERINADNRVEQACYRGCQK